MYSNLRFVIATSVVGCAGLIGVLALLPATLEERLLASAELAAPAARPCKQQIWLNLDRNCLTRRGMPWVAALPARDAAEVPSSAETAAEQPVTEARSSPTAAEDAAHHRHPADLDPGRLLLLCSPVRTAASRSAKVSGMTPGYRAAS